MREPDHQERFPTRDDMEFVSEPIEPARGSFSPEMMARGLAALPQAFAWRGKHYRIVACLDHAKVTSPEGGAAGNEVYLRRQEFLVRLDSGQHAVIYVLRSAPSAAAAKSRSRRWFLYGIEPAR